MSRRALGPYIWDPSAECVSRSELEQLQARRLGETVRRAVQHVPFYWNQCAAAGVDPSSVRSLDDLRRIPFTVKDDLRAYYPFGLLAVPKAEILRLHTSTGTTGRPTLTAYTRRDLELWADLIARALAATGVRRGSVCHIAYGYGLFTGGLGFQYGAERIGALVVPSSVGSPARQVSLLAGLGADFLLCTPSYAATLLDSAAEAQLDLSSIGLSAGVFGGEAWSEGLRRHIELSFGLRAHDTYGLSEIIGPGVAHECESRGGLHLYEDHFIAEVVAPHSHEVLPDGELVLTTLTREATPLLRYRTGDLTRICRDPCPCGRTFLRIARIPTRMSQVLEVAGVRLYVTDIEEALLRCPHTTTNFQASVVNSELLVRAELHHDQAAPAVADAMSQRLAVRVQIESVQRGSIPRSLGKAARLA